MKLSFDIIYDSGSWSMYGNLSAKPDKFVRQLAINFSPCLVIVSPTIVYPAVLSYGSICDTSVFNNFSSLSHFSLHFSSFKFTLNLVLPLRVLSPQPPKNSTPILFLSLSLFFSLFSLNSLHSVRGVERVERFVKCLFLARLAPEAGFRGGEPILGDGLKKCFWHAPLSSVTHGDSKRIPRLGRVVDTHIAIYPATDLG